MELDSNNHSLYLLYYHLELVIQYRRKVIDPDISNVIDIERSLTNMTHHHFHLDATWNGGRLGEGSISTGNLNTKISIPTELGGPGIGSNPEDMLLGAAATCYLITLAAVLDNRKLPVQRLTLTTQGIVNAEGGMRFEKIIHRPQIVLSSDATEENIETAHKATNRAEKGCMISKALHGNVEVTVEAVVTVE